MAGCHNINKGTYNGKDTESHVPAPVASTIAFQVDRVTGGGEAAEHEPKGYDKRNDFHADHGIGNQVDAENNVDDSSHDIPAPARHTFSIANCKEDFQDTAYQHRYAENDT